MIKSQYDVKMIAKWLQIHFVVMFISFDINVISGSVWDRTLFK